MNKLVSIAAFIAKLVFADTSYVIASISLFDDELAVRTSPEVKHILEKGYLQLIALAIVLFVKAIQTEKILACVAFEGIIVEYDVSKALFSGADTEVCIPKLLIALTHLDVSYLKGVWQGLEELASSVHLSVASFLGAADFFVENHFELNILEQARVAEMIMFAVGVAGAFATIEFFHANLAFEVP